MSLLKKVGQRIFIQMGVYSLVILPLAASPLYMAKEHQPGDFILINFFDAPTNARSGFEEGNIAAFHLGISNGFANDYLTWSFDIPAYSITQNAALGNSKASLGNISFGLEVDIPIQDTNLEVSEGSMQEEPRLNNMEEARIGVKIGANAYSPSSRESEAFHVSLSQPTTDYLRYYPKSFGMAGRLTGYINDDLWTARSSVGLLFQHITAESLRYGDTNRYNFSWMTAGSLTLIPLVSLNLEYNTIILDTGSALIEGEDNFRHAATPSVSTQLGPVALNAFMNFPLDSTTRERTNFTFGLVAGTKL